MLLKFSVFKTKFVISIAWSSSEYCVFCPPPPPPPPPGSVPRGWSSGSFGMQHLNEKVVIGHVPIHVLVVQVVFCLLADCPDLWKPKK